MSTTSQTHTSIDAAREWRSSLTGIISALLAFETVTGFSIYLLPFNEFNQFSVILHTLLGLVMLLPLIWFIVRHWLVRGKGKLSHYQLLGYVALAFLAICMLSGFILTWQGIFETRINYTWDVIHLLTSIGLVLFLVIHLVTVIVRKVTDSSSDLLKARWSFYMQTLLGCGLLLVVCSVWVTMYKEPPIQNSFSEDYNWRFGEYRPFAPSMARLDYSAWQDDLQQQAFIAIGNEARAAYLTAMQSQNATEPLGFFTQVKQVTAQLDLKPNQQRELNAVLAKAAQQIKTTGSIEPHALAKSEQCGSSGCHEQIYKEWLPSAHRYSSLDEIFQQVQTLMADETSPEHTRYCAGCHDPISLFTGAKNSGNITLSAEGAHEGSSCIVCHSIVQTDIQGNADYTIKPPQRYVYELDERPLAKFISDFLIRTYPQHHLHSYSRSLYKTPEFCGACHKQYIDKEVNTDIGRIQGQNQYDSWKNSRWYHEDDSEKTLTCRECHMPLKDSHDPAKGDITDYNRTVDDGKHRSHNMAAANQYIPTLQNLEGGEEHVEWVEKWLRGEFKIPEIAEKWTTGPVVRMKIVAPETVMPEQKVNVQVILTNNKTGHDFPTGPLDMIESWVELTITDDNDNIVYQVGHLDENDKVESSPFIFRADGFDRQGKLIDRHNLWDLVGASYKRAMYPGVTDTTQITFQCPSMARGRVTDEEASPGERTEQFSFPAPTDKLHNLTVKATLWYRKANPDFLDRVYGVENKVRSPITKMTEETTKIKVIENVQAVIN
ncbi:multiheme c-type cytochrome [Candidatus Parabeggiatoa sp. HSG14]|uniref:multiheme c-type cytochrome n=1 Tax=Candidatus Parabeggiatoa sp. HSG14 TaxID=3055593 RepID=UPI0025A913E2|nr:multiheme c-type cytochrome [Thiotrichales bacterium HSG14]